MALFSLSGLFRPPQQRKKGRGNLNPISLVGKQEAAAATEAEDEADVLEASRKLLSRSLGHQGKERTREGRRGRVREKRCRDVFPTKTLPKAGARVHDALAQVRLGLILTSQFVFIDSAVPNCLSKASHSLVLLYLFDQST